MTSARNWVYNLLRRSEKLFKTDMVYLAKGGFWLTSGQIISTAASIGLAIAFANLISSTTYGTYQFILSIAGILSTTTLAGFNTAAIRSVALGSEGVILSSLKTKLRWGIVGSFFSLVLASYYFINGNSTLAISFTIVAIFLPPFYSLTISSALLKGKKLFSYDVRYSVTIHIFATLVLITTLFLTENIYVILLAYFISWTVARLIIFKITSKKFLENRRNDPQTAPYGKHLSAMGMLSTVADNLDKVILFHFLGAVEVAIYSFAIAPVIQLKGLIKNLHTLALPKLALRSKEEMGNKVVARSLILIFITLPVVIAYIVAAPHVYKLLFPNYIEAIRYSQVFSFALLFMAAGAVPGITLDAQMEIKKKYFLTFFSKISKIILILILTVHYGIWGMITGILINYLLVVSLAIWLVKKK